MTILASSTVILAVAAEPGGAAADHGVMQTVIVELRKVRIEVLDLRIELQERRIPELQREYDALVLERKRIEQEAQMRQEALAEMDRQVAAAQLSPEDKAEFEKRRAELGGSSDSPLRTQQELLAKREADIRSRLQQELDRWQSLTLQRLSASRN